MNAFKDHFSERAAGYAAHRPQYPAAIAQWLESVAPSKALAWDAGCGNGQLSVLLGDRFEKVIASDASESQVANAVKHPRVEYRVEPAERSSLADGSASVITVAQAAHWLDLPAFYREVRRVGRSRAVIALIAYGRTRIEPAIDIVVEQFYGVDLDGWWPPERKHIESGYRTLAFPFRPLAAPALEIQVSWTADQFLGYIRTWSAVRAMENSKGHAATERFATELRRVWDSKARHVAWPLTILAGTV